MRRVPVPDAPVTDRRGVGGIGIDAEDDLGELRVPVAERGVVGADIVDGPVDRVQVHRRLHRRQLLPPLEVLRDQLVGELVDEVRPPVALKTLRVEPVEQALEQRETAPAPTPCSSGVPTSWTGASSRAASSSAPVDAPHHRAHLAHVQLGREQVDRRDGHRGEEAADLARRRGQELAVEAHHLGQSARSARTSGRPSRSPRADACANSNEVTTPKLPPPPRSAQNRSGCSSALAWTCEPSARRRRPRSGCRSSGRSAATDGRGRRRA